jgi:hypothetical protein
MEILKVATATNPITRLSLEELAERREWQVLSERQRMFVIAYITSGIEQGFYDAETAARMAYDVKSHGSGAKRLGCQLVGHKKVKAILDLHFGTKPDPLESILSDLRKAIRKSLKSGKITVATQKAIEFYEKHAGVSIAVPEPSRVKSETPEPEPIQAKRPITEEPPFEVGDRIKQGSKIYIVKAVGADGWPTDASEEV